MSAFLRSRSITRPRYLRWSRDGPICIGKSLRNAATSSPSTSVEEMRLIAIVTGIAKPKAMLLDPAGVGHVVERGDYLGRPKVLQATGSVSMTLNWRVDRIRENEVVLTQQDPSDPNRFALTKIIPLREETTQKL